MPWQHSIAGGQGNLIAKSLQSPNFNLANPSASPPNSWALLQSGLAYMFGLVLSGGTVTGPNYIINSSGIFIYSGTPAAGNLVIAIAGTGGTDGFGNGYGAGFTSEGALGASANISSAAISLVSGVNVISEITPNGWFIYSPHGALGNLVSSFAAASGTDSYGNAYLAGNVGYTSVAGFFYATQSGWFGAAGTPTGVAWYTSPAAGGPWARTIVANGDSTGNLRISTPPAAAVIFAGQVTATGGTQGSPSLITTDVWTTITLDAGWSVTAGHPAPQYRLQADGSVAFLGAATHASFTSALALNSGAALPAALRPANFQSSSGDVNSAGCELNTGGVLLGEPQTGGSTMLSLDGRIFWPGK